MRQPLTETRKQAFLSELRRTGSVVGAAAAATPWSKGVRRGAQTFRDERKRDPEFALAWDATLEALLGEVESEIVRRAMEVPKRPVWERGKLKGWIEDRRSSDHILLRLAARLDPSWRERTTIDQNVSVQGAVLTISPHDVLLLSRDEQEMFLEMIRKIADARGEEDNGLPKLLGEGEAPTAP